MARFDNGWIKIHRTLIEGDIADNAYCLSIFIHLLSWAALKPSKIRMNGESRELSRGSVVVGLRQLADKIGCSKTTVKRQIDYLKSRDSISIETGHEGTIISITNFESYQTYEKYSVHNVSAECTPSVRHVTPSEEVNKEEDNTCAKFDFEFIYKNYPLKKGKSAGMKVARREIKTPADFDALEIAVKNYRRTVELEKTEPRFIKHFGTFMNCWRDFVDSSYGTSITSVKTPALRKVDL